MPRVFLSYRQESDEHCALVLAFARRLKRDGLTVVLDQLAQEEEFNFGGPNEGWPEWSTKQAGNADNKVLIVGTRSWFRVFEREEIAGVGLGAAAEAGMIRQRLYNGGGVNPDIRIVSFGSLDHHSVPMELQRYHRFVDPHDFENMVRWLSGGAPAVHTVEEWPATTPSLSWAMANHEPVRRSFAQLITCSPPFRYLPIRGASCTGKTHITKQFLSNALRSDGLACGRFDFKGVTDAEAEMKRFVQNLDIRLPPGLTDIGRQFEAVLDALIARKRPALLIFDTFEAAGLLDQWVKDTLLVALIRQKWLRVVVAGQRVPEAGPSSHWAAECPPTLVLTPPSADHWFDFSRSHRPDFTREKVDVLYEGAYGDCMLLSQMLCPRGS